MQSRIAISALNIFKNSLEFKQYQNLGAKNQIDTLVKRIELICEEFKNTEPDSQWFVGWREHGVFEPPQPDRGYTEKSPISVETKAYLHSEMQKLIEKYPKLTILAGTVIVERKLEESEKQYKSADDKLAKLESRYKNYEWIEEIENKRTKATRQVFKEREHIKKLKNSSHLDDKKNLTVLSNTTYIFTAEQTADEKKEVKVKILKHRKSSPFNERTHDRQIFRPASPDTHTPIFKLQDPITQQENRFGYEICREHNAGIVEKTMQDDLLVHFIASDYIAPCMQKIRGKYVVQFDSVFPPRLIVTDEKLLANPTVHLYQHNILTKNKDVLGPLKPFYPLDYQIRDQLNSAIAEYRLALPVLSSMYASFLKDEEKHNPNAIKNLKNLLMTIPLSNNLLIHIQHSIFDEKSPIKNYKHFIIECIRNLETEEKNILDIKNKYTNFFMPHRALEYVKKACAEITTPPSSFFKLFGKAKDRSGDYIYHIAKNILNSMATYKSAPDCQYLDSVKPAPLLGKKVAVEEIKIKEEEKKDEKKMLP